MKRPRVKFILGKRDLGDIGKFYGADKLGECYHFTVDDDILYPQNYTSYMIEKIEQYGRKAVMGAHGALVRYPCANYYKDRTHNHFKAENKEDRFFNFLGTGTTAFHSSTIQISERDFQIPNMADIFFGIAAHKQEVPMVVVKKQAGWMQPCRLASYIGSIHQTSKNARGGKIQTNLINRYFEENGYSVHKCERVS